MDFVTDLPKSSKHNFSAILILVCHLTKMAHFVPCHKEITAEEIADLFIDNCYKLHGVPKVIVSDRDPRFFCKFWQSFMRKLNTKLDMSTVRHPQTDGLIERVNETMQILLRCYITESRFDWVSPLPMVEFHYNCSINEASKHSPFYVSNGFHH
jgi:transposase InsO family protein